jgi:alpha-L-fucosidase 2
VAAGAPLKKATGKNSNVFFHVEETPSAIISEKATIAPLEIKATMAYDLPTTAGKTYTIVAQ